VTASHPEILSWMPLIKRTLVSMVLPVILAAAFHKAFPTFEIILGVVVVTAALLVAFTPAARSLEDRDPSQRPDRAVIPEMLRARRAKRLADRAARQADV
jgi:hypothetical protein